MYIEIFSTPFATKTPFNQKIASGGVKSCFCHNFGEFANFSTKTGLKWRAHGALSCRRVKSIIRESYVCVVVIAKVEKISIYINLFFFRFWDFGQTSEGHISGGFASFQNLRPVLDSSDPPLYSHKKIFFFRTDLSTFFFQNQNKPSKVTFFENFIFQIQKKTSKSDTFWKQYF